MSTLKRNQVMEEPSTVQACQRDYGTPAERAGRAADAEAQAETAKWNGRAAAEAPGGRR